MEIHTVSVLHMGYDSHLHGTALIHFGTRRVCFTMLHPPFGVSYLVEYGREFDWNTHLQKERHAGSRIRTLAELSI